MLEKEKEQIINAYQIGWYHGRINNDPNYEYYNKTYGGNK